ncbi:MAG: TSUP family transporter [Candidatus Korobacteraceae bacterium]
MKCVSAKFLVVGLGTGILAGVLSGLVGIGGGVVIVPALVYFGGFNQKLAQGTSLAVLLPPTGALAFWQYYRTGNVDLRMAALIVLGLLLGGWVGGGWAQELSNSALRKGFAIFLMFAALNMWFGK